MRLLTESEIESKRKHEKDFTRDCIKGLNLGGGAFNSNAAWLILECIGPAPNFEENLEAAMLLWKKVQSLYSERKLRLDLIEVSNGWHTITLDPRGYTIRSDTYNNPAAAVAEISVIMYKERLRKLRSDAIDQVIGGGA